MLEATMTKVESRGIFFPDSILLIVACAMREVRANCAWLQPRASRNVRMRWPIHLATSSSLVMLLVHP